MKLSDLLKKIGVVLTDEQQMMYDNLKPAEKNLVPQSRINELNVEIENYETQLSEMQKKFKSEAKLQKELEDIKNQLESTKKEKEDFVKQQNFKEVVSKFKVKDIEDLKGLLNDPDVKFENNSFKGLEEKITELKTKKPYFFELDETTEQTKPAGTIKGAVPAPPSGEQAKPVKFTKEMLAKMTPQETLQHLPAIEKQLKDGGIN